MSDRSPTAIDANVIVRFLTKDHEHYAPARAIFEAVRDGKAQVVCDPVNLAEVVWVLQSYYREPPERVGKALADLVKAPNFVVPQKERYLKALELYAARKLSFADACACAAALDDCDGRIYSFDRKLSGVPGVERLERAGDGEPA